MDRGAATRWRRRSTARRCCRTSRDGEDGSAEVRTCGSAGVRRCRIERRTAVGVREGGLRAVVAASLLAIPRQTRGSGDVDLRGTWIWGRESGDVDLGTWIWGRGSGDVDLEMWI